MSKLAVIYTGGTLGMVQTDAGFAPKEGLVETALRDIDPDLDITVLDPLIDSSQATPHDWNRIATAIHEGGHDSYVVLHGTDTMAYTAAALCLALEGLNAPVILSGAMKPLSVEFSDAPRNMLDSLTFAKVAEPGVWLQFAGKLLHGAQLTKKHSLKADAFDAPSADHPPRIDTGEQALHLAQPQSIGVYTVVPGDTGDSLMHMAQSSSGLILRCFGSGTLPAHPNIKAALDTASELDTPVIAISQAGRGGVQLGTYAAGELLTECEVIDGHDMTLEMTYTKLTYALSRFESLEDQVAYLSTRQCGEWND